ncbi:hypothetical protein JAAARDRAFT_141893 [Jaapia argillacea MUCL 33604]|uniref:GST N-terminal domain-containing protein n=1 Tax=Jaapia argillacea MUCL 33604 TaxID=933084 RepID=A0A067PJ56_9AGAM|nr:hypothetical protein JAAARDRAFT_141893 [Jaapia argillacea MUCL 33604]
MSNIITLYDIPSRLGETAWSPNTLKAKFSLHYKGLPFKTVWVEYPDVATVCKEIGAEPTQTEPSPFYTLPVIHDPSTNKTISDSFAIAEYLDETYPDTPSLFPKGSLALQAAFQKVVKETCIAPIFPIVFSYTNSILNSRSQEYFRGTREKWFGKTLEELSPEESAKREEDWEKVRTGWDILAGWMRKNREGDFIMGDTLSFADITVAAALTAIIRIMGPEFERTEVMKDGTLSRMMKAFGNYD